MTFFILGTTGRKDIAAERRNESGGISPLTFILWALLKGGDLFARVGILYRPLVRKHWAAPWVGFCQCPELYTAPINIGKKNLWGRKPN